MDTLTVEDFLSYVGYEGDSRRIVSGRATKRASSPNYYHWILDLTYSLMLNDQ